MKDAFEIQDESGDRKYFTIIPNYILNHSTANAQALYLQLKRLAGEDGKAYPSADYLISRLHISRPTLRKEMKYLLEHGWIERTRDTSVKIGDGIQKMKSYIIVDIWKKNVGEYTGGKNSTGRRGKKEILTGGKNSTPIKNIREEELQPASPAAPHVFSLEDTLKRWESGSKREFEVLAWFIKERGLSPTSQARLDDIVDRHIKAAKKLEKYTDSEIVSAQKESSKFEGWTLETILKHITK